MQHIIYGVDSIGQQYVVTCGTIDIVICGWGGWSWTLDGEFAGACDYTGPIYIDTIETGG